MGTSGSGPDNGWGARRHDGSEHSHGSPGWTPRALSRSLAHLFVPHEHDTAERVDRAMETSRAGMRALWISLLALGVTAAGQAAVFALSGSVALLSDTLHNVADALTAVPLGIAFLLGRRPATRRFPYGYGRAEDVAGVVVVLVVAVSAVAALVESAGRLLSPGDMSDPLIVAAAGVVGFVGNEIAAVVRVRTGRRIGSAALVADGLHARTDSLTSLGVVLAAAGSAAGWSFADPLVGLAIGFAIAVVTYSAAKRVLARLMDSVAPELVDRASEALEGHPEVRTVDAVRLRWIGHALHAEVELGVFGGLTLSRAHEVAHEAERRLRGELPRLEGATVHTHPAGASHANNS
ncbi:cation diffusion facilitator family transporter [Actinopolyspora biskrensis]|uniref:Cation diffusion facilitator family transporter n=1 Tax=Actinopolyspora biskrensis TaxID=1470178 RepID=A0A852Z1X9_9ACTN|nr:cation diffusion facilitator family transporter [Actinopolyspora biskrensis]NYH80012.1 cation diffusion facilitator family transporter [Actinopolyspora biskrensis]